MLPLTHVTTFTETPHYSIPTGPQYTSIQNIQQHPIPQYSLPSIPVIEAGTASPHPITHTEPSFNHTLYNMYKYISSSRLVGEL